ncbi:MAG TPA: hypothetical protein VHL53_11335, partial [Acidimicrobiia bacterium]|nr:hypothetical protein [Acidimicrobiia bacterium]
MRAVEIHPQDDSRPDYPGMVLVVVTAVLLLVSGPVRGWTRPHPKRIRLVEHSHVIEAPAGTQQRLIAPPIRRAP